jgi:hypothetical protein
MSVLMTDFSGLNFCLCVIVIFICESSALGEDKLHGSYSMFCVILIFFCECSVLGENRLQGIYNVFLCDCDNYLG